MLYLTKLYKIVIWNYFVRLLYCIFNQYSNANLNTLVLIDNLDHACNDSKYLWEKYKSNEEHKCYCNKKLRE